MITFVFSFFNSRLLGRFAPIFYFNWEHFLCDKQKCRGFYKKKSRGFSKFNQNRILLEANFLFGHQ